MTSGPVRLAGRRQIFPLTTMYGVRRTTISDQPPTPSCGDLLVGRTTAGHLPGWAYGVTPAANTDLVELQ
jgi:hypothetical protein